MATAAPPTYSDQGLTNASISYGGGSDSSLTSTGAGLASYSGVGSGTYNGNTVTYRTAVTTSDGNITAANFAAVLSTTNVTINGVQTHFVSYPMYIGQTLYAGYLTTGSGLMIAVQALPANGISVYNINSLF
jgi:hypothetical protein